jgi:hypothetical protein
MGHTPIDTECPNSQDEQNSFEHSLGYIEICCFDS